MKRPETLQPDDGRVVASMELLSGEGRSSESNSASPPAMTRKETRAIMVSATLAGLTVAAVLSLAVVGLVLFCQFVWFR